MTGGALGKGAHSSPGKGTTVPFDFHNAARKLNSCFARLKSYLTLLSDVGKRGYWEKPDALRVVHHAV